MIRTIFKYRKFFLNSNCVAEVNTWRTKRPNLQPPELRQMAPALETLRLYV